MAAPTVIIQFGIDNNWGIYHHATFIDGWSIFKDFMA